jgi:rubrerythrin
MWVKGDVRLSYSDLIYGIQQSVKLELEYSDYYIKLAKKAPGDYEKNIILDIGKEKKADAKLLKEAHYNLTGRMADINLETKNVPDYPAGLRDLVMEETKILGIYKEYYLATKLEWIRDLFFGLIQTEEIHIIKLFLLINNLSAE